VSPSRGHKGHKAHRISERTTERPYDPAASDRRHFRARRPAAPPEGLAWTWGWHPVQAALANPQRPAPTRLLATPERAPALRQDVSGNLLERLEVLPAGEIARELPQSAVHQGVALLGEPPEPLGLGELAASSGGVLVMLDHVTDPQNVGAIFRSAAALGADGVVLQDRHAPVLAGALAKASAGAIDRIPHARVVNLSRALEQLDALGWRAVGLAGEAEETLETVLDGRPTVLVLGSEGEGIRRLVAEHCDALARIDMPGGFESLNVSAAAAVALYAAQRAKASRQGSA
jgi:23S rRNA (guanosine2251-2'-O)-methyltransferase